MLGRKTRAAVHAIQGDRHLIRNLAPNGGERRQGVAKAVKLDTWWLLPQPLREISFLCPELGSF
jgi:hypothetical protein